MMSPFDEALANVLKRGKYNALTGRSVDLKQALQDLLRKFLEWIFGNLNIPQPKAMEASGANWAQGFAGALLAAVIAAVAIAIFRIARKKMKQEPAMDDVFAGIDPKRAPKELIAAAQEFWENGQPRDAVRHMFAATLLALDQSGTISIGISKTNKQLSDEIKKKAPHFLSRFKSVSNAFQLVWFGGKSLEQEAFSAALGEGSKLVEEAGLEKR
jgi:hypothetical protein